ncbi:MAG: Flp family type IVb pilin [Acetobacteraceae bacterium]
MTRLLAKLQALRADRKGVTAIEYGLIAALIAVVLIAAVGLVGTELGNTFNFIAEELINARGS